MLRRARFNKLAAALGALFYQRCIHISQLYRLLGPMQAFSKEMLRIFAKSLWVPNHERNRLNNQLAAPICVKNQPQILRGTKETIFAPLRPGIPEEGGSCGMKTGQRF